MTYHYETYGFTLESELALPELTPTRESARADIVIRFGETAWSPQLFAAESKVREVAEDEIRYYWKWAGKFIARGGREIIIEPTPEADENTIRLFLLGTMLAVILHQRGRLVLHASAVEIDGEAVAFVGQKGMGKSTIAASLQRRGHRPVADDLVAVDVLSSGEAIVTPGFPQYKLDSEAATMLGISQANLTMLHPQLEKLAYRFSPLENRTLPLNSIFILGESPDVCVTRTNVQDAFGAVVANTYLIKLIRESGSIAAHFKQCAAITGSISVYKMLRPKTFGLLDEVARTIERTVGESFAAQTSSANHRRATPQHSL